MKNLNPEQRQKRAAAHAAAACATTTLWTNWPHPIRSTKPKSKKVFTPKTRSYKLARSFKAGHGRYS